MSSANASAYAVRELPLAADWLRIVGGLRGRPGFWWLDSARVDARLGRFSFAGAEPWCVLRSGGARSLVEVRRAVRPGQHPGRSAHWGDPLDALRALLPPASRPPYAYRTAFEPPTSVPRAVRRKLTRLSCAV